MLSTDLFRSAVTTYQSYTVGDVSFRLISLPGMDGFAMGNDEGEEGSSSWEQPKHLRTINAFCMAEFPVTQQLWEAVVVQGRARGMLREQDLPLNPAYFKGASRPVERVNWHQARSFCKVLSKLTAGKSDFFRLPSEAEWEYAARAGSRAMLYAGSNQLNEVGWYDGNNEKETMPVGLLTPNAFGLYDLSGNVWEWCEDDWHGNYENHPRNSEAWVDDPNPDKRASNRVQRGGSWSYGAWYCRCAGRYRNGPDFRGFSYGFRLSAPV